MRPIIVQHSFMQHGFDTPTVGHSRIYAANAEAAIAIMRRYYSQPWITLRAWDA